MGWICGRGVAVCLWMLLPIRIETATPHKSARHWPSPSGRGLGEGESLCAADSGDNRHSRPPPSFPRNRESTPALSDTPGRTGVLDSGLRRNDGGEMRNDGQWVGWRWGGVSPSPNPLPLGEGFWGLRQRSGVRIVITSHSHRHSVPPSPPFYSPPPSFRRRPESRTPVYPSVSIGRGWIPGFAGMTEAGGNDGGRAGVMMRYGGLAGRRRWGRMMRRRRG